MQVTRLQFAFQFHLWASDTVHASFFVTFPHSFASICLLAVSGPAIVSRSINQMIGQLA